MNTWEINYVRVNRLRLIENTECNVELITDLESVSLLTKNEGDVLSKLEKHDKLESSKKLYSFLESRTNAYGKLAKSLFKTNQTHAFQLLLEGLKQNETKSPLQHCEINLFDALENSWSSEVSLQANKEIMAYKFKFLGETFEFKEIFGEMEKENTLKILKGTTLGLELRASFLNGNNIVTKNKIPDIPQYYITRQLSILNRLDPSIFKETIPDVFAFKGIERCELARLADQLTDTSTRQIADFSKIRFILLDSEDDFEILSTLCRRSQMNIHLIKYMDGECIWERTCGSTKNINHVLQTKSKVSEDDVIKVLQRDDNNPLGLSDLPGMGKTMFLKNLAHKLHTQNKNVVWVEFKDFVNSLPTPNISLRSIQRAFVDKISYNYNILGKTIAQKMVEDKTSRIFIFLDGFDEQLKHQIENGAYILRFIVENFKNIKLVVSTRILHNDIVENSLGIKSYSLIPFTNEDQVSFLIKYWELKDNVNGNKTKYAQECLNILESTDSDLIADIAGVPLQCSILADICLRNLHRLSDTVKSIVPTRTMTVLDLYTEVVNFKVEEAKRRNEIKFSFRRVLKCLYNKTNFSLLIQDTLTLFALDELFPCISKHLQANFFQNEAKQLGYKFGLIRSIEEPQFVHRTYAEYFVARFISIKIFRQDRLTGIKINPYIFTNFFLNNILEVYENDETLVPSGIFPVNTISAFSFVHRGIVYFINAFSKIYNRHLEQNEFQNHLQESAVALNLEYLHQKINACVRSNFGSLLKLCLSLYELQTNENIPFPWLQCTLLAAKYLNKTSNLDDFFNARYINKSLHFSKFESDTKISPLHVAVHVGDFSKFEYFWKFEKFSKFSRKYLLHFCLLDSIGNSELVIREKKSIIKYIIKNEEHILHEKLTYHNSTSLLQRCIHPDLIKCVIELGANVNDVSYSMDSVLHMALKKRNGVLSLDLRTLKEILGILQKLKFQKINYKNSARETTLHLAVKHIHDLDETAIEMFIELGADINASDGNCENILFLAIRNNRSAAFIKYLFRKGVCCTVINERKETIFHVAAQHSNYEIIDFLLTTVPMLTDDLNMFLDTILHIALKRNSCDSTEIRRRIIKSGVLLDIKNEKGNIPIVEAYRYGNGLSIKLEILHLLKKEGLVINSEIASRCITAMLLNSNLTRFDLENDFTLHLEYMINLGGDFKCHGEASAYSFDVVRQNISRILGKNPNVFDSYFEDIEAGSKMLFSPNFPTDRNLFFECLVRSKFPVAKLCWVLLKNQRQAAFLYLRQALWSCATDIIMFKDVPSGIENLDNQRKSLVISTADINVCIYRFKESAGGNISVFRNHTPENKKADIVLVKVGEDQSLLFGNQNYYEYGQKVIFLTTINSKDFEYQSSIRDFVKWNDFTSCYQNTMMRKSRKNSTENIKKFKPRHFEALSEYLLIRLAGESYMCDDVLRSLTVSSFAELKLSVFETKLVEIAFETVFPDKWSSELKLSQNSNFRELEIFKTKQIIVEDSSTMTNYKFLYRMDACFVLGNYVAQGCYNSKVIHKMFLGTFFSLEQYNMLYYDIDNKKHVLSASIFRNPDIVYFFSLSSNTSNVFKDIFQNKKEEYIQACIHSNMVDLLQSLDDDLDISMEGILLAIKFCNVSTMRYITAEYLKSSHSKLSQLGFSGKFNISPLVVAIQRGNYAMLDYVLHAFYSQADFITRDKDIRNIFSHCVNDTYENDINEIDERKEIIHLLRDKLVTYGYRENYFKRILVETKNVHIELIKFLIDFGADVTEVDSQSSTILHRTSKYFNESEYLDLTVFFIYRNLGHVFHSRNLNDRSPIRCALLHLRKKSPDSDEEDICKVIRLINKKAGIPYTLFNKDGETVLNCAYKGKRTLNVINTIKTLKTLQENIDTID